MIPLGPLRSHKLPSEVYGGRGGTEGRRHQLIGLNRDGVEVGELRPKGLLANPHVVPKPGGAAVVNRKPRSPGEVRFEGLDGGPER